VARVPRTAQSGPQQAAILAHREVAPLLSDEHFSVDGTLVKAWASMKSFQLKAEATPPDDEGPGDPPPPATTTECRDTAANDQPLRPTRNCPGLTEIPVRDFAKPAQNRVRNGFSVRFVVFLPFDKRLHIRSQHQSHFMAMGLCYPAPIV
jgi:hypothetical protein